jgi:hypothetical protein
MTIKTCRSGLGEATERKRKVDEQRAMRVVMAQKRQKHEQEWKQNIRAKVVSKEMERDLFRSQKVCVELDSQQVCILSGEFDLQQVCVEHDSRQVCMLSAEFDSLAAGLCQARLTAGLYT